VIVEQGWSLKPQSHAFTSQRVGDLKIVLFIRVSEGRPMDVQLPAFGELRLALGEI